MSVTRITPTAWPIALFLLAGCTPSALPAEAPATIVEAPRDANERSNGAPADSGAPAATGASTPSPPSTPSTPTPTSTAAPPPPSAPSTTLSEAGTEEDRIRFEFRDKSVPPPHHRSYTIVATRGFIRKTVTSYGTVLADAQLPFTSEAFDKLVRALRTYGVASKPAGNARVACAGGTGRSLDVRVARRTQVTGTAERCGASEAGSLGGNLDAWVAELDKVAPKGAAATARAEDKGY